MHWQKWKYPNEKIEKKRGVVVGEKRIACKNQMAWAGLFCVYLIIKYVYCADRGDMKQLYWYIDGENLSHIIFLSHTKKPPLS